MSCGKHKKRPARDHRAGLMLFEPASTTSTSDLTTMAAPRVRTSPTSRQAAEDIRGQLGRLEALVLRALRDAGPVGQTDDEMQRLLCLQGNTQRPRRVELLNRGLIVASGGYRPTLTGRRATVWILARLGSEEAAP